MSLCSIERAPLMRQMLRCRPWRMRIQGGQIPCLEGQPRSLLQVLTPPVVLPQTQARQVVARGVEAEGRVAKLEAYPSPSVLDEVSGSR